MKRLIAFALVSLALAIGITGCAHERLNRPTVRNAAVVAAMIGGLVFLASQYNCGDCNIQPNATQPR
jgi:hypothetical protein